MIKKMLVNATHPEENRVAIVEDGILSELDIEITGKEQTKGNIYKASVIRVEQGLQAAFVDYGAERLGFLQLGELHPGLFPKRDDDSKGRPRIHDILHRGQELLVQIVKEERGQKGAALTTFLSLPGRYMVLMPQDKTRGMSRKIPDGSERKQLKQALAGLELPDEIGYIIRTAAIGQTPDELKRDLDYLLRVYNNILDHSRKVKAPALIYRESNLVIRSIRDYFTPDMDEVLVDDPKFAQEARDFFQQVMPEYVNLVKLHQEKRPIFSRYQIEDQIETISHKQVALPSGGSIVIDTTEALVAIDVNSGKMASEQGVEGTAYKTNLEAAVEAARQLRLRDLGGLVVIDFIDMRDRKHIREVEKRLKDALAKDKARVSVGRISQFGLLEMSRQRIKAALAEGSFLDCPNCQGTGRVKSSEAQAVAFLRRLQAAAARGQIERIEGEVPIDVAHYLLNNKREELSEMERKYQLSIFVRARKSFVASQFELIVHKREKGERKPDELNAPVTALSGMVESGATPAEPTENKTVAEPAHANGEDTEAAPAKSSRSRRRRRRGNKQAAAEAAAAETAEIQVEGAPATAPAAEAEATQPEPAVAAEATEPGEATPAKSSRSRRRRRKPGKQAVAGAEAATTEPATEAAGAQAVAAAETVPAGEPAETQAEQSAAAPAESGETPVPAKKPRRGRRKPSKPAAAEADAPAAGVGTPAATSEAPAVAAAETAPAVTPAKAQAEQPVVAATAEQDETTEPAKKPRRSRRKPSAAAEKPATQDQAAAETATGAVQAEPTASEPAQATTAEEVKPAAAKPTRSRRRSSKPKPQEAAQEASTSASTSDQSQAGPSPAPQVPEAAAEPAASETEAKKPAKRTPRTRSKKAAEAEPAKTEAPQAAEDKPAEKKKPARKPAAKKAAATKTETGDSDKPAPRRRTRSTAAKAKSSDQETAEK